mgnify:CR=1 FL=1|tara:strand:- start:6891 stop:8111 length:1221 start_codon:yes stop_codon:yes gene_type:complete
MRGDFLYVIVIYVAKAAIFFTPLFVFGQLQDVDVAKDFILGYSLYVVAIPIVDMGYRIQVFRAFVRGDAYRARDVVRGAAIKLAVCLAFALATIAFLDNKTVATFLPFALAAVLASYGNHCLFFVGATRSFAYEAIGQSINAVVFVGIFVFITLDPSLYGIPILIAACLYLGIGVTYFLHFAAKNSDAAADQPAARETWRNSLETIIPYTIHVYAATLIGMADNLFISAFSTAMTIAVFSVFMRMVQSANTITSPYIQYVTPRISRAVRSGNPDELRHFERLDFCIGAVLATFAFVFYDIILDLVFPNQSGVLTGTVYLGIFIVTVFFKAISLSSSVLLSMAGKQWLRVYTLLFFVLTGYSMYYLLGHKGIVYLCLVLSYMIIGTSVTYLFFGYRVKRSIGVRHDV